MVNVVTPRSKQHPTDQVALGSKPRSTRSMDWWALLGSNRRPGDDASPTLPTHQKDFVSADANTGRRASWSIETG
jgi:hypothetical protein